MRTVLKRSMSQATVDPTAYVAVLALGYACALLAGQIWTDVEVLPGLTPSEIVVWLSVVTGLLLWLRCRVWSRSALVRAFLGVVLVLWVLTMTLELVRGPVPERASLSLGLALALMIAKPPGPEAALRAMTVLAWAICGLAAASIALEALGVAWAWSSTADAFGLGDFERDSYWLPISDVLGIHGRWAGPFLHPNRAGPVAAVLLVFGLRRAGTSGWVFALTGLVMLALTASRASEIAALAGVVTMIVAQLFLRERRQEAFPRGLAALVFAGVVVLLMAPVVLPPGSGTAVGPRAYLASAASGMGRTTIWPEYVRLGEQSPWTGIGAGGIFDAIAKGALPAWAIHAHNTFLDVAARHGVVALLLLIGLLTSALIVTVGSCRRGLPLGLALLAVVVVNSMGHTVMSFVFPEFPLWVLLLAVMMSVPDGGTHDDG